MTAVFLTGLTSGVLWGFHEPINVKHLARGLHQPALTEHQRWARWSRRPLRCIFCSPQFAWPAGLPVGPAHEFSTMCVDCCGETSLLPHSFLRLGPWMSAGGWEEALCNSEADDPSTANLVILSWGDPGPVSETPSPFSYHLLGSCVTACWHILPATPWSWET